jgi:hypothetical protein
MKIRKYIEDIPDKGYNIKISEEEDKILVFPYLTELGYDDLFNLYYAMKNIEKNNLNSFEYSNIKILRGSIQHNSNLNRNSGYRKCVVCNKICDKNCNNKSSFVIRFKKITDSVPNSLALHKDCVENFYKIIKFPWNNKDIIVMNGLEIVE